MLRTFFCALPCAKYTLSDAPQKNTVVFDLKTTACRIKNHWFCNQKPVVFHSTDSGFVSDTQWFFIQQAVVLQSERHQTPIYHNTGGFLFINPAVDFFTNMRLNLFCKMRYRFLKRKNPIDRNAPEKTFATPVYNGKIDIEQIASDLVLISSISIGDILSVIRNLLDALPKYLLNGYTVQLGELGTFRVSFSSEGVDNPDEFVVAKIRNRRIVFIPGPAFRKMLRDLVFEKEKEKKN